MRWSSSYKSFFSPDNFNRFWFQYYEDCNVNFYTYECRNCKKNNLDINGLCYDRTNCLIDSIFYTCYEYLEGVYLVDYNCDSYLNSGCLSLSSDCKCIECSENYFLDNKAYCQSCLNNCRICENQFECISCVEYISLTSSKTCEYVNTCMFSVGNACKLCYEHFGLINEVHCEYCSPKCFYCKNEVCYFCRIGYEVIDNSCISTVEFCAIFNDLGICTYCQDGYFLLNNMCILKDNCSIYNNEGKCIECEGNYYLRNQKCTYYLADCLQFDENFYCISCPEGYYSAGSSCYLSINNCLLYQGLECYFYLEGYTSLGYACVSNPNCRLEDESGKCLLCKHDYYFDENSLCKSSNGCLIVHNKKCVKCNYEFALISNECVNYGCLLYNEDLSCNLCKSGFKLSASKYCISCNPDYHCNDCNDINQCTDCLSGYSLDPNSYSCIPTSLPEGCIDNDCKKCWGAYMHSFGECIKAEFNLLDYTKFYISKCVQRFYYQNGKCLHCSSSCYVCFSRDLCAICNQGYYLDQGLCFKCQEGCLFCKNPYFCYFCEAEFALEDGKCVYLGKEYDCYGKYTTSNCGCAFNYFKDTNEKCITCVDFCEICSNRESCLSFKSGYYGTYENDLYVSKKCVQNCASCNSEKCSQCNSKYYINSSFQCDECPEGCMYCYLVNNVAECFLCSDGFYLDNSIGRCLPCNSSCKTCINSESCAICKENYDISESYCIKCLDNCLHCSEPLTCYECKSGYYLNSDFTECIKCGLPCLNCKYSSPCSVCNDGYFDNGGSLCEKCPSNCNKCYYYNTCYECDYGYYRGLNYLCLRVPENCIKYDDQTCISYCNQGYYADRIDRICKPCENFCYICSKDECLQCFDNYYLDSGTKKCKPCIENCAYCHNENCIRCHHGYYLDDLGNCKAKCDERCQICYRGDCKICKTGNNLITTDQYCLPKDPLCKIFIRNKCIECIEGHYYAENKCLSECSLTCKTCYKGKFIECIEGYGIDNNTEDCGICSNTTIKDAYFNNEFLSISVIYAANFNKNINDCSAIHALKDYLGKDPSCYIKLNIFTIKFGQDFKFSNTSEFYIDHRLLFTLSCESYSQKNITARYNSQPSKPEILLKGEKQISIPCSLSTHKYTVGYTSGSLSNLINYTWFAKSEPYNKEAEDFISNQTNSVLNISSALFKNSCILYINVNVTNPIKEITTSSIIVEISNEKKIKVSIDVGTEIDIQASKKLIMIGKAIENCECTKINFNWVLNETDDAIYNKTRVFDNSYPPQIVINSNTLSPGNTYIFKLKAKCNNIEGYSLVKVNVMHTDLVIILDQASGSASKNFDLIIDATLSNDPDSTAILIFDWSCKYLSGSSCNDLIEDRTSSIFTIEKSNLPSESSLNISLSLTDELSERESSYFIIIDIIEGLQTVIKTSWYSTIVEPCYFPKILVDINSTTLYTLEWIQALGKSAKILSTEYPQLDIDPKSLKRGELYQFKITATEISGKSAHAFIEFQTNQLPSCDSKLAISPSNGYSLITVFDFIIENCNDEDAHLPLAYSFGLHMGKRIYYISTSKSFNSAKCKLFTGSIIGFAKVCDQLNGCSHYNSSNINVQTFNGRRIKEESLTNYIIDTQDNELIPLYSIAYLYTYQFNSTEILYIYNTLLDYLKERNIYDQETLDILTSTILAIYSYQNTSDIFADHYLIFIDDIKDMIENYGIVNIDTLANIFEISVENINIESNFTIIDSFDDLISYASELYTYNALPNTSCINLETNDAFYYKDKQLSDIFNNYIIDFADNSSVFIESLQVNSQDIINVIVKIYPQSEMISKAISVGFKNSGSFDGEVLIMGDEIEIDIRISSIYVKLELQASSEGDYDCCFVSNEACIEKNCEIVGILNNTVEFKIFENGRYTITEKQSSKSSYNYTAIIATSIVLFLTITGFFILKYISIRFATDKNEKTRSYRILKYHLTLSLFIRDPHNLRHIKYLWLMSILNIQMAIQETLILLEKKTFNQEINFVGKAFISAIITIPLHVVFIIIFKRSYNAIRLLYNIIVGSLSICSTIFIILYALIFIKDYQDMWLFITLLSFLIEFLLEILIMIIRKIVHNFRNRNENKIQVVNNNDVERKELHENRETENPNKNEQCYKIILK